MAMTNDPMVQRADAAPKEDGLRYYLSRPEVTSRIDAVASKYFTAAEIVRLTLVAASRDPKIAQCTSQSILRCLLEAAAIGVRPGGILGRGWLIPRYNGRIKAYELTFDPGWRGLADVAKRSGVVARIEAHVVRDKDLFREVLGTSPRLEHIPFDDGEPGDIRAAYAVAFFSDGGTQVEVVRRSDLEKIRAASAAKDREGRPTGPWRDWPEEMARKTAVRRLCKYLPYDEELEQAIEVSTRAEMTADATPKSSLDDDKPRAQQLAERIRSNGASPSEPPPVADPFAEPHDAEPPPDVETVE